MTVDLVLSLRLSKRPIAPGVEAIQSLEFQLHVCQGSMGFVIAKLIECPCEFLTILKMHLHYGHIDMGTQWLSINSGGDIGGQGGLPPLSLPL